MLTRAQIEADYKVENGIIRSPGMFEGECAYLPRFWEVYMNGFADEQSGGILSVLVDADDKAEFPELKRRERVRFYQRDDGFVCEI